MKTSVIGKGTEYKQPMDSPGSLRATYQEGIIIKARNQWLVIGRLHIPIKVFGISEEREI